MSEIVAEFPIPFVDKVTIPAHWARWLSGRGQTNPKLRSAAMELDDMQSVIWEYGIHGPAPWMQFFYDWRFADLTGNGQIDMLLTCGAQRQIAYRWEGDVIWEYHDPAAGFMDIRLDTNFPVVDINRDDVPELICVRKLSGQLSLCIVNAQNGQVIKAIPLPALEHRPRDCRGSILIANLSGNPKPNEIIFSWDYTWIGAFTSKLELIWERELSHEDDRQHVTMGHTPFPADINADGKDEIIAGSCLLNTAGETIWVEPDLPALMQDGHADSVQITYLDEDDDPVVLMSTGAYCFSADGSLRWGRDDLKHGQALRVGKLRSDLAGKQIVVYEAASRVDDDALDRIVALDKAGNFLWDFTIQQPDMQEGGFGFWVGDWTGDGCDEVFVNDPKNINILNGYGEVIESIPGHLIYVFDLVGDLRVEAVMLDKIAPEMRLQIVTNDQPNPNPSTNQILKVRETTKAMYNCTRY